MSRTQTQINAKEKILDYLGSSVDNLFLGIPKIIQPFRPIRKITREEYEKQLDFYINNHYTDQPESFFSFPSKMPEYSIVNEKNYQDGKKQLISYKSNYEARNPYIRSKYESFQSNKTGYLIRWTHGKKSNKTVMCLHGYMLGEPHQAENMFKIINLYNMGLDVVLFITPFHWKRAPESKALRGIFLKPDDVGWTCECIGQTIFDLYGAFQILKNMDIPEIGIIGASLGGYIASIFVSLTDVSSFAALMVPAVNFSKPLGPESAKLKFSVDAELGRKINLVWELHSPLHFMPKISKERILVVASRGDKVCPFDHVQMLCEKWQISDYHFQTGGHWLIFNDARGQVWYKFLDKMGFGKENQRK